MDPEKKESEFTKYQNNRIPWWIYVMWAVFAVWGVIYLVKFALKDFLRWW